MRNILNRQNKKAVSMMIGYVLLVSFAVIMGVIVFAWLRTYVPNETIECPDEVSILIRSVDCVKASAQAGSYVLSVNLSNNGNFDIDGFYLRATNTPTQKLATQDLSKLVIKGGSAPGNFVQFLDVFAPSERESLEFFPIQGEIYSIEVTPMRFENIEGKIRLSSCARSKVKEVVSCES